MIITAMLSKVKLMEIFKIFFLKIFFKAKIQNEVYQKINF